MIVLTINDKSVKGPNSGHQPVGTFLRKTNFHQSLRKEILFHLMPRTLKSNSPNERKRQTATLFDLVQRLSNRSILWDEGLKQLGTIIEFDNLTGKSWTYTYRAPSITAFINQG